MHLTASAGRWLILGSLCAGLCSGVVSGDDRAAVQAQPQQPGEPVPLNKQGTVLLDVKGKRVLLKTRVVLREGLLEMLVCKKDTKEHESILAIDAQAYVIHTALLALGMKPGTPVEFSPTYKPATGQRIDIFLQWQDADGKLHRAPAQRWVRRATRRFYGQELAKLPPGVKLPEESELRYDEKQGELSWFGIMSAEQRDALLKLSDDLAFQQAIRFFYERSQPRQMDASWIFVGSQFYEDQSTGKRNYAAEMGDVICVANFPSALIDVDVKSSASGEDNLLFEPYTERIPPEGTEVLVELVPVFEKTEPAAERK